MSYNPTQTFNPLACEEVRPPLHQSQIPSAADVALKKSEWSRLSEIYTSAIAWGMTSSQIIAQKFGDDTPDLIQSGSTLNPAKCASVLKFLSSLNPDNATGNKLPWRHAQCALVAATPTLPNQPRRAAGRQPR